MLFDSEIFGFRFFFSQGESSVSLRYVKFRCFVDSNAERFDFVFWVHGSLKFYD